MREEPTGVALLETLEVHVFNFNDGRRSNRTIINFKLRETMNVALTSHPAARLKDFPTPSRRAHPTANSPDNLWILDPEEMEYGTSQPASYG